MERDEDDDIRTPDPSSSNSSDEDEENSSTFPPSPRTEEIVQSESSQNDTSKDVGKEIKPITAAKPATFITSSSSSSSSNSVTDFVALNTNDFNPNGSATINAVS